MSSSLNNGDKEDRLYKPILEHLKDVFDRFYVAKPMNYPYQRVTLEWLKNPHLEITAEGKFSQLLQGHFDYYLFQKLGSERLRPDIMGFVRKKESCKPEMITVEVKNGEIGLRDVLQAKLYEEFFRSKFSFAISPMGISIEKLEVVLKHDKAIRGNVIIGQCGNDGKSLWINSALMNKIPKVFRSLCRQDK